MGANMVRRLLLTATVVAYNRTAGEDPRDHDRGLPTAPSRSPELVATLAKPRVVWVMVPSGDATEAMIDELARASSSPATRSSTAATRNFHDDGPAPRQGRRPRASNFVDAGISGGVWGLKIGYCLMVGGEPRAGGAPWSRSSATLAPEDGYLHAGGPGAGHYVKMVHNGIEYGLMQAYAEGFEILHASDYTLDLAAVADALELRLRRPLVAARAGRARAFAQGQDLAERQGLGRRLGRGPLDGPGGDRHGRPGARSSRSACSDAVPVAARTTATRPRCSPRCGNEFGGHAVKTE